MPIRPEDLRTGGALHGAVAESLLRQRDAAALLGVGDQIGIYRVIGELGRGGMAVVYLAERADGEYTQQVALKWMLGARLDAGAELLFRRERQALADLRHPHIARLLDGGRSPDGRPWFAMELIEGAPLDRHCAMAKLPLAQRLVLFQQVCAAVAFAHARGILHRDIKPSNVLVDAEGSARLLDFGIAQLIGEEMGPEARAHTPDFASPEQLRGEVLTVASDVFQLGRLLTVLLSSDDNEWAGPTATMSSGVGSGEASTPPHSWLPRHLPADLAAIVRKATQTDPQQRYPTANALTADLDAYVAMRPVDARGRHPAYIGWRYIQRHRLGVGLAAIALAVLLLTGWIAAERVREQRDVARAERDAAEQARASTQALNRFLHEDLLDAANPLRRAPGAPDVTVREALDAGEARIETRFGDQPALAVELLTMLGYLRFEFGADERAMALYEQALQHAQVLPESHPARIRLLAARASLLITLQDFDTAALEIERLLPLAESVHGSKDERVLELRLRLLEARSAQGANLSQLDALRALAERAGTVLGTHNAISGEALLMAANAQVFGGRADEAHADAGAAHAALTQILGADHPSTLKAMAALAHGLHAQGRNEDALQTLREAHRLQRARYGPDALDSLFLLNELSFMLSAIGQHAEAEQGFAEQVQRHRAQDSPPSLVAQALSNLATAKQQQGRAAEALADYREALAAIAEAGEAPAAMLVRIRRGEGDSLRALGRPQEALVALDAAAAEAAALPDDDPRRALIEGSRALVWIDQGDFQRGRDLLDASIATLQSQVSPSTPALRTLMAARAALDDGAATATTGAPDG